MLQNLVTEDKMVFDNMQCPENRKNRDVNYGKHMSKEDFVTKYTSHIQMNDDVLKETKDAAPYVNTINNEDGHTNMNVKISLV
ncbi:hypothetical protein IEQ34_000447 [Dendrobium chrysotoxum]|uniref:Uncharacterized protein n=1 Tax=Dendrobium chrysotoxum TaxID=161865 RepID=A0AAV7HR98_DENCH|nr:hypothetical protein IEQ34_000447 [Dendrobium chrysotoxum]